MTERERRILYIEEDLDSLSDCFEMLREKYRLEVGADWDLIKQPREEPFDLLILDIMIHTDSRDSENKIVESIRFPGVKWRQTGLEFLRRLRKGDYTSFGLPPDTPVVVASAVVDHLVKEEIINDLGVDREAYLEKPFTMDALEAAVDMFTGG